MYSCRTCVQLFQKLLCCCTVSVFVPVPVLVPYPCRCFLAEIIDNKDENNEKSRFALWITIGAEFIREAMSI